MPEGLVDWHTHAVAPDLAAPPEPGSYPWPIMRREADDRAVMWVGERRYRELDDRCWSAPRRLADMDADGSLIKGLVEESVRWMSPVKHFCRTASEDTELRGVTIRKGDRLMLNYPSGNRDEEYFDDAEEFDLKRSPNKHLGFGYGAHGCVGLHIARQEMAILWEELLPHVKSIEVTGDPQPVKTNFVASFKSLPVRITRA